MSTAEGKQEWRGLESTTLCVVQIVSETSRDASSQTLYAGWGLLSVHLCRLSSPSFPFGQISFTTVSCSISCPSRWEGMSFPRARWDLGQEEVLSGAILTLGRGHQPYHHLSCSHGHAVDPRAMCRERALCQLKDGKPQADSGLWGGCGPLVLMPLRFSTDYFFEALWAKPGCLSCGFIIAGCSALPGLLPCWPASCPACALSHPSLPAPAFLQ